MLQYVVQWEHLVYFVRSLQDSGMAACVLRCRVASLKG